MNIGFKLAVSGLFLITAACALSTDTSQTLSATDQEIGSFDTIQTVTADGVTIYGEPYLGTLDPSSPLIMLYHQGGSNGRGEYAPIAAWLNENGFRAIAWDQRSGGETYGELNRTKSGLKDTTPAGFCDARPDLQAALDYVMDNKLADEVILWGSSYSAALIFGLAAENKDVVSGVIAFSPASGGPLADCRAQMWIDEVNAPVLVMRPASEMERASVQEQQEILTQAGAKFIIAENGIHGSSMLVDERTEYDMSQVRQDVLNWLKTPQSP